MIDGGGPAWRGSEGGGSSEMKLTMRIGSVTCTASVTPVIEPTPRLTRIA